MTHVKLLSVLLGAFLYLCAIGGVFGILIAKIFGYATIGGIILLIYFFIHGITFGEPSGNGFD